MADIANGIAEAARTAFLAGVGAVAFGAEKTTEFVDTLVKKGELTVDQGKDLNRELTQKAKDTVNEAQDTVLRARLATMSPAEREAFADRARQIASDMNAKASEDAGATVDVVVEAEDGDAEAAE